MYFGATPFSAAAFSDVGFNPNAFVNVLGSRINVNIGNSTISGNASFSVTGNPLPNNTSLALPIIVTLPVDIFTRLPVTEKLAFPDVVELPMLSLIHISEPTRPY